jgi:hypothetical protein
VRRWGGCGCSAAPAGHFFVLPSALLCAEKLRKTLENKAILLDFGGEFWSNLVALKGCGEGAGNTFAACPKPG